MLCLAWRPISLSESTLRSRVERRQLVESSSPLSSRDHHEPLAMSTRTSAALTETDCSALQLLARGKVRDIYAVPGHDDALLFVATDRVSAFDVIMKNGIPNKGKLLTSLSLFFFNYLATHPDTKHIPNHVITSDLDRMPQLVHQYRDQLEGRSIWVRKATILPVEAIVRGYITGATPFSLLSSQVAAKLTPSRSQALHGPSTKSRAPCTVSNSPRA